MLFIRDGPFDVLGFGEVHSLSDGRGEVDIVLLAVFAFDELHFGWIAHGVSSHKTRYIVKNSPHSRCVLSSQGQTPGVALATHQARGSAPLKESRRSAAEKRI